MTSISTKPALILLPNLLGDHRYHAPFLPSSVDKVVSTLDGLIAESEQVGRRYLSRFETKKPAKEIPIAVYNKNNPDDDIDFMLEPIVKGERWGLLSDSGLPCMADPGSKLVRRARQRGLQVQAFVGPSSVTHALMLSGLPGQKFYFHGYLDKDFQNRHREILKMEKHSAKEQCTEIFIETPYRNQALIEQLVSVLSDDTWLCAAWELTMPEQGVLSQTVGQWKKSPLPNLEKKNAIFLISAI